MIYVARELTSFAKIVEPDCARAVRKELEKWAPNLIFSQRTNICVRHVKSLEFLIGSNGHSELLARVH